MKESLDSSHPSLDTIDKPIPASGLKSILTLIILIRTALIVVLAIWNYRHSYSSTVQTANASANESFHKDLIYRRWATRHSGVYVPITLHTTPNLNLTHISELNRKEIAGEIEAFEQY